MVPNVSVFPDFNLKHITSEQETKSSPQESVTPLKMRRFLLGNDHILVGGFNLSKKY